MAGGLVDRAVEIAGLVNRIGIREKEPAAARFASRGPDGVVLSCPAFFEFAGFEHGDTAETACDLGGAISGLIIDNDKFPVDAKLKDVLRLRDQRFQTCREILLFIAGGDDDGEFDELFRFGLIVDGAGASGNGEWLAGSSDNPGRA